MNMVGTQELERTPAYEQEIGIGGRLASGKRKLFIALPIYGPMDSHFVQCLLKIAQDISLGDFHGVIMPYIGDSLIGRARNVLTRMFLESDCTHLLFIDSDLVFSLEQIRRILLHDEPIVGGLYCKKQEGAPAIVWNLLPGKSRQENGLLEVRYIGTGFLRVAREVFDSMIDKFGDQIWYRCDHDKNIKEHDLWPCGVYEYPDGGRRYLSEDWYFCQRAMDCGYKVWADMHIMCKHSGNAVYPLSYQESQLYSPAMAVENFQSPEDCAGAVSDVFRGEYEFGIDAGKAPRVADVGATCGEFTAWARWKWPDATVMAYEPNPELFEYLVNNCKPIADCVTAECAGIGIPDKDKLYKGAETRLTGSMYRNGHQSEESVPIKVIPPSELKGFNLIKISAEGAEADIVEGLTDLPTHLICVYHTRENKFRIQNALANRMVLLCDRQKSAETGVMAFRKA